MKPAEFIEKWKNGMHNLSPLQLLKAQIHGTIGSIFGILFAGVFMVYNGMWYFLITMFFVIFLQVISLIGILQKYNNTKKMVEEVENIELYKKISGDL